MFRPKGKLSIGMRNKSSSLLTLNEIDAIEKSSDWRKKYTIRPKEIGRGHFSKVYHVSCDDRKKSFAAKVIRRRKGGIDRLEKIKQEAALIRKLNALGVHSVIQLFETYENFSDVVLISELAKGGCLFKLVRESESGLRPDYVKVVTLKLLLALEAMHAENIVHLDIKADNILLREPYPSTDIALCDFGLATQLKEGKGHKELVGTPDYMAPEVINYEKVTVNADMWSVGVLIYYLLTAVSPFMGKSKEETLVNVSKVKISFDEIFDESEYADAKDFILSLCVRSPESRLSSTTSQTHSWFTNVVNDDSDLAVEHFFNDSHGNCVFEDNVTFTEDISSLTRSQRWQSVDTIDLTSALSHPSSFKPLSFSAISCENIFTDCSDQGQPSLTLIDSDCARNLSCKLTNVEEVNDEVANEPCSRDASGCCLVDSPTSNVNNHVSQTPVIDSGCNCPPVNSLTTFTDTNPPCTKNHIVTSLGKVVLKETSVDGSYTKDANILSDLSTTDTRFSDSYLQILKFEDTDGDREAASSSAVKTHRLSLSNSTDSSEYDCPSSPWVSANFLESCCLF